MEVQGMMPLICKVTALAFELEPKMVLAYSQPMKHKYNTP